MNQASSPTNKFENKTTMTVAMMIRSSRDSQLLPGESVPPPKSSPVVMEMTLKSEYPGTESYMQLINILVR